jgi:biopolymer transport protein ExbD
MGVMELLRQGGFTKIKLVALEAAAANPAAAPAAEAAKP